MTELEVLAGGEEQVGLQFTGEVRLVSIVGGIGVTLDIVGIQAAGPVGGAGRVDGEVSVLRVNAVRLVKAVDHVGIPQVGEVVLRLDVAAVFRGQVAPVVEPLEKVDPGTMLPREC